MLSQGFQSAQQAPAQPAQANSAAQHDPAAPPPAVPNAGYNPLNSITLTQPMVQQQMQQHLQAAPQLNVQAPASYHATAQATGPASPTSSTASGTSSAWAGFGGTAGASPPPMFATPRPRSALPRRGPSAATPSHGRLELQRLLLQRLSTLPLAKRSVLLARLHHEPKLSALFVPSAAAGSTQPFSHSTHAEAEELIRDAAEAVAADPSPVAPSPPSAADSGATTTTAAAGASPAPPTSVHSSPTESVSLHLTPEFSVYPEQPNAGSTSVAARVVVSLRAGPARGPRARASLSCVLDRSGSMSGARMELLQETMHFAIDQLASQDYLGIVSYSSDTTQDLPLLPMCAAGKALAHAVVDALVADGGTALYAGTVAGMAQQVHAEREGQRPGAGMLRRIIAAVTRSGSRKDSGSGSTAAVETPLVRAVLLCTDGQANEGPRDADAILPALRKQHEEWGLSEPLTTHTFGIGRGHDSRLLQAVAEAQSGMYFNIAQTDDISDAYGAALGGVLSVAAQNIKLHITPLDGSGVRIAGVHTGGQVTHGSDGARSVAFRDLFAEENKEVLLELALPPQHSGSGAAGGPSRMDISGRLDDDLLDDGELIPPLVRVTLSYTDAFTGHAVTTEQVVALPRGPISRPDPASADAAPDADPLVVLTASRYSTAAVLRSAQEGVKSGKREEAKKAVDDHVLKLKAASKCLTPSPAALSTADAGTKERLQRQAALMGALVAQAEEASKELEQRQVTASYFEQNCTVMMQQRGTFMASATVHAEHQTSKACKAAFYTPTVAGMSRTAKASVDAALASKKARS